MSLEDITPDYKFVILPPYSKGGNWYGYVIHDTIKDLDEEVYAYERTAGKCATELTKLLTEWVDKSAT